MTWSNQVAVVTGGARGIGRAIALLLAKRGAAVCVNYAARADAAEQVASEIKGEGGRAITAGADIADFRAVQMMIGRALGAMYPKRSRRPSTRNHGFAHIAASVSASFDS